MKVKELKEALSTVSDELEVLVYNAFNEYGVVSAGEDREEDGSTYFALCTEDLLYDSAEEL